MAARGNAEYMTFAQRTIKAAGRRVAEGDVAELASLMELQQHVRDALDVAVQGLIAEGFSIGDIARHIGMSRQAVQQRWALTIQAGIAQRQAVAS